MTTHTPAESLAAQNTRMLGEALLREQDLRAERDALKVALRNIIEPVPFGVEGHVDFHTALVQARSLLARLDGKEAL